MRSKIILLFFVYYILVYIMYGIKPIFESSQLQMEIKNNKNIIALFSATWCGPCKTIKPVYQQYSQDNKYSDILFLYVDIDEAEELCEVYKIRSVPTFILFVDGKVQEELQGNDRIKLKKLLDSTL
jgi:thioredoxin 1